MSGISLDEILIDNSSAIKIQDSAGDELDINADGSINATIGSQAFVYAEDTAHVSGDEGAFMLAVRSDTKGSTGDTDGDYVALIQDADGDLYVTDTVAQTSLAGILAALANVTDGSALTVTATDFDIRDLINTQDSIAIGDETNIIDLQQMDSAFGLTSFGFGIFGVRQDAAGSPVSADGDAHPLVFNNDGELKVAADLTSDVGDDDADSGNPIKVGGRGVSGALTALSASGDRYDLLGDLYRRTWVNTSKNIGILNSAGTVTNTATEFLASPLAGRRAVTIQNEGTGPIWVGSSAGVTNANGIKISRNSSATYEWGEDIDIFLISNANQDVRLLEEA